MDGRAVQQLGQALGSQGGSIRPFKRTKLIDMDIAEPGGVSQLPKKRPALQALG